jgi:hypothetical protein
MADKVEMRFAQYGTYRKLIAKLNRADKVLTGEKTMKAQKELAILAQERMVEGINGGREGWESLTEITKAIKGDARILIDSGSFVNSITIWKKAKRWFAGIPAGAKGEKGQDLQLVGAVHEGGATVPVSDELRRFFAHKGFPLRESTQYLRIPMRPWFAPAMREVDQMAKGILNSLADQIIKDLG